MFIIYCLFSVVVKLSESSVFSIIIGHFFLLSEVRFLKAAIGKWCESRLRARILVERERAGSLKPVKSGLGPFWVVELFFFFSHKSKSGLFLLKGEKWQKLYSMYKIFQVFFTGL